MHIHTHTHMHTHTCTHRHAHTHTHVIIIIYGIYIAPITVAIQSLSAGHHNKQLSSHSTPEGNWNHQRPSQLPGKHTGDMLLCKLYTALHLEPIRTKTYTLFDKWWWKDVNLEFCQGSGISAYSLRFFIVEGSLTGALAHGPSELVVLTQKEIW